MQPSSRLRAGLPALLVPLALGLAGCGAEIDASTSFDPPMELGPTAPPSPSTAALIDSMRDAPTRERYRGSRRVELHWTYDDRQHDLIYREEVASDGDGGFAVSTTEVLEPSSLSTGERDRFLLLQKPRTGFAFRYRDFRVRQTDLFLANYAVRDNGTVETIAGRQALHLTVQRKRNATNLYEVWVDQQNGLVLRADELEGGQLVSRVEFTSLAFDFDDASVDWHDPITDEVPLPSGDSQRVTGYEMAEPELIPRGYRPQERVYFSDPRDGRIWTKSVFTDGLEQIFFLRTKPSATEPDDRPVGPGLDKVSWLPMGPWIIAQATVRGDPVIVLGRMSERELLAMIESAFF